ncbi:MAG: periplasmic heavy metal sensor [Acidobacteriota bacterium]|nr:periplasmic heavy metal sensor [Acidobacteriota bacterium]
MKITKYITAAVFSAALVFAQGRGPRDGGGTPPDPQTMIQNRVDRLTTLLTLTDAQKAQATTIFTNAFTSSQTLQTSLRTARESLPAAVKANNPASIDTIAASIGTLTGQLTAIQSKADAAFYSLLTADQRTKYDSMPHGGPGGPGGFGGPGARPARSGGPF